MTVCLGLMWVISALVFLSLIPLFFFTNVLFFELVVCPLLLWKMLHLTVAVPTTNTVGLDPEQKCCFWLK